MPPNPRTYAGSLLLLPIVAVCLLLFPGEALCRLSAEAELGYVNYEVKDDVRGRLTANSLTQRYSLLYNTNGRILDGRFGRYDVALGYEWATFDTSIKAPTAKEAPSQSRGHLLFRGEVIVDPKELPLKLRLYSQDLSRTYFVNDSSTLLNSFGSSTISSFQSDPGSQIYGGIRDTSLPGRQPEIGTSIINGQHIDTGGTLIMGVKNGMTNGYNEFLRHFPMVMLDYRDQINKDLHADYPVDNRLSRLAFVSLNKKDNWFHYRYTTYKDYIDPVNDYRETQVQIGTVDQTLQRRWIDFANWLQISADGQLTKRVSQLGTDVSDEISLNFFGAARRETWEARSFNNFIRLKENNSLITYKTTIPLYANGLLGKDATWNAFVSYNDNTTNTNEHFTTVNANYRIDAFRNADFTLTHGLGMEHVSTTASTADMVTGTIGTTSTPRFSRRFSVGGTYTIRSYFYDTSTNFIDQDLTGNVNYAPSDTLRLTLDQSNRLTSGRSQYIASNIAGASTSTPQYYDPRNYTTNSGSSYQSITRVGVTWTPKPRLVMGLNVSEDIYVPAEGDRSTITRIEGSISYNSSNLSFSSRTAYASGNSVADYATNNIRSENKLTYIFNRNLDARAGLAYYKALGKERGVDVFNVEQALNYYYYRTSGITRKLFEINQAFVSADEIVSGSLSQDTRRNNYFSLGAKYYPLRQIMLAAGTRYNFVKQFSDYTISYYGSISAQFRLLEASLDYSYGKSTTDNRIEKRFSANVKKKF